MVHVTTIILLIAATTSLVTADNNPRADVSGADRGSYTQCVQVPSLHCHNGSTCQEGISKIAKQHSHLNLQTHESGYFCKCINGFIGHECRIQVDDCDGDTGYNPSDPTGVLTSCYHGAKCRVNNGGSLGGAKYCDCNQLNEDSGPTAMKFAGLMCQHESTSMCAASLVGTHSPNHQFCTNHGKCVKLVSDTEPHPGCVCNEGYTGDHCEIHVDSLSMIQQSDEKGNVIAGKVLFSLMIVAMGGVVTGIGVLLMKEKRKRDAISGGVKQSSTKKTVVVGAGDLEADGSGTLGNDTNSASKESSFVIDDDDDGDADGDMELTLKEEVVVTENEENSESPANRVDEDEKPEIV